MRIPKQNMPGCALILDEYLVQEAYGIRSAHGNPPHDEVWEGLLILKPLPDNQHQSILARIQMPIMDCCSDDKVRFGVNITDRHPDWLFNFRCPDFVIYKRENPAVCHDMYWLGGPDFLIEVIMPNDLSRDKLPFYAKVGTREVRHSSITQWKPGFTKTGLDGFFVHGEEARHTDGLRNCDSGGATDSAGGGVAPCD